METVSLENQSISYTKLKESNRKRPNKAKLLNQARLRGFNTSNEQLMLTGLTVHNILQRINNKAFEEMIKNHNCKKIEKLMIEFVYNANKILQNMK